MAIHRLLAVLATISIVGCASGNNFSEDLPECHTDLSRSGFLQELLFAQGTARTPLFNDYTENSYHVEKLDLLEGVRELRQQGESVIGLSVFGPYGLLWSYNVTLFIRADDTVTVNWLQFAHARIRFKGTRKTDVAAYEAFLSKLTSASAMAAGAPSIDNLEAETNPDLPLDWNYGLLLVDWSTGSEQIWYSKGDWLTLAPEDMEEIGSVFEELLEDSVDTYSTSLPEGYETYVCPEP